MEKDEKYDNGKKMLMEKKMTMGKYDNGKRWWWKKDDDGKSAEKILPWCDPLGACRHYKLGNLNRDPKFDHDSDSFLSSKVFSLDIDLGLLNKIYREDCCLPLVPNILRTFSESLPKSDTYLRDRKLLKATS